MCLCAHQRPRKKLPAAKKVRLGFCALQGHTEAYRQIWFVEASYPFFRGALPSLVAVDECSAVLFDCFVQVRSGVRHSRVWGRGKLRVEVECNLDPGDTFATNLLRALETATATPV